MTIEAGQRGGAQDADPSRAIGMFFFFLFFLTVLIFLNNYRYHDNTRG